MDKATFIALLASQLPNELAEDIVDNFLQIRQDVASHTLGRAAPGKFVETYVQILQFVDKGKYDKKPAIDAYLRDIDSKAPALDEGLRICASRILRSMYTLRNKRNILHKGDVDPNAYDLNYLLAAAQWCITELVRYVSGHSMEKAGALVQQAQTPVGALVEDFGDERIVHGDITIREELLLVLHSHYPDYVPVKQLVKSLQRRSEGSVKNEIRALWGDKLTHGSAKEGYKLTSTGLREAIEIARNAT